MAALVDSGECNSYRGLSSNAKEQDSPSKRNSA